MLKSEPQQQNPSLKVKPKPKKQPVNNGALYLANSMLQMQESQKYNSQLRNRISKRRKELEQKFQSGKTTTKNEDKKGDIVENHEH